MNTINVLFKRVNSSQLKKIINIQFTTLNPKSDSKEEMKEIWDSTMELFLEFLADQHEKGNYKFLYDDKYRLMDAMNNLHHKIGLDKDGNTFLFDLIETLIIKEYIAEASLVIARKNYLLKPSESIALKNKLSKIIVDNGFISKKIFDKYLANEEIFKLFNSNFISNSGINLFEYFTLYTLDRNSLNFECLRYVDGYLRRLTNVDKIKLGDFNFYSSTYIFNEGVYATDLLFIFKERGECQDKVEISNSNNNDYLSTAILEQNTLSTFPFNKIIHFKECGQIVREIIPYMNSVSKLISLLNRANNAKVRCEGDDIEEINEIIELILRTIESLCKNSSNKKYFEQLVAELKLIREELGIIVTESLEDALTPLVDMANVRKLIFEYKLK